MPERFSANWPLKLLALAVAVGIWIWVSGEARMVRQFDVPLDIIVSPEHTLATPAPSTILVRLGGPETMMRRLDRPAMTMVLDLSRAEVGRQEIPLAPDDLVGAPSRAVVELIEPHRLTIILERRAERRLPVEPTFLGQPPEGFSFYGASVAPSAVNVEGPESQVLAIDAIPTSPIRLDLHSTSFDLVVRVLPTQPMIRQIDPRPVQVRVHIDASPIERVFSNVPVRLRGPSDLLQLNVSHADITVTGPPSLVDELDAERLQLYVVAPEGAPLDTPLDLSIEVDWGIDNPPTAAGLSVKKLRPRVATLTSSSGVSKEPTR